MKKLLRLDEASKILKCSPRKVRRFIDAGVIAGCKIGGSKRVVYESVENYIESQIQKYQEENGPADF